MGELEDIYKTEEFKSFFIKNELLNIILDKIDKHKGERS